MIAWHLKPFQELSTLQLYQVMRLRQEVFVFEQDCAFIDADQKDLHCYHLMGYLGTELVAYARIVPAGLAYKEVSIGRISTQLEYRRKGFGRELMQRALQDVEKLYGHVNIRIEAQLYLKKFYEDYEFVQQTPPYILDDIEHIVMLRTVVDDRRQTTDHGNPGTKKFES